MCLVRIADEAPIDQFKRIIAWRTRDPDLREHSFRNDLGSFAEINSSVWPGEATILHHSIG
jgi:hypothetical protein